jgi:shikimate 5-dehydrogenase/shikimate kinase
MITVLIGHRGSGKSQLARRISEYHSQNNLNCIVADLDQTIEKAEHISIQEIFKTQGEAAFRAFEQRHFKILCEELRELSEAGIPVFISVGAGFSASPEEYPLSYLWVRRPTDSQGRIFLDRPRLHPDHSPIQEFLERYQQRQPRYHQWAHEQLTISEGFDRPNPAEQDFFLNTLRAFEAIITLLPGDFGDLSRGFQRWKSFIRKRIDWGIRFELRDDLLDERQIQLALRDIPHSQILYSFRNTLRTSDQRLNLGAGALFDWPAELGPNAPLNLKPSIFSLHERTSLETVSAAGRRLEQLKGQASSHLKLAVEVHDFHELIEGHHWAQEDPANRSFLPRSPDGRWSWYRLLVKNPRKLNFVREGDGSAADQPYLLEWVRTPENPKTFAAILGNPVGHSRTPAEQYEFFAQKNMPVLPISITPTEWTHGALTVLQQLGLRAAAVTSPLKVLASESVQRKTPTAARFHSVNTILWSEKEIGWVGTNTDFDGLRALFAKLQGTETVAIWGAGGTLPLLRELLPHAIFFSARTGSARTGNSQTDPEVVVWGVGRSHYREQDAAAWPPLSWRPQWVIDLNYSEDSPGREYALRTGAKYLSGMEMFLAQARGQREFWESGSGDSQLENP